MTARVGAGLARPAACPALSPQEARRNNEAAVRLYPAPAEIELPENAKLVEVTVG